MRPSPVSRTRSTRAVAVTSIRRSRYTNLPKTRLAHVFTATAVNLTRLAAWWSGASPNQRHTSHLARLDLAA